MPASFDNESFERAARPKRDSWGGFDPGRFVDQLHLPSAENAMVLLWPPRDSFGFDVPLAQRVSR